MRPRKPDKRQGWEDQADRELEAAAKASAKNIATLEERARSSYWAALNLRTALLEDLAAAPTMRATLKEVAPEDAVDDDPGLKEWEERTLSRLVRCNDRLGWPFPRDPRSPPNLIGQAVDGALAATRLMRGLDRFGTTPFSRFLRWCVFFCGVAYLYWRVGPEALLVLTVPIAGWVGLLLFGAASALLRPLFGIGWFGRFLRGVASGSLLGTLLILPLLPLLALTHPHLDTYVYAAIITGAIYGPLYQPGDDLWRCVYQKGAI